MPLGIECERPPEYKLTGLQSYWVGLFKDQFWMLTRFENMVDASKYCTDLTHLTDGNFVLFQFIRDRKYTQSKDKLILVDRGSQFQEGRYVRIYKTTDLYKIPSLNKKSVTVSSMEGEMRVIKMHNINWELVLWR
jgi:hypothetical protein